MDHDKIKNIIEAALMAADGPLTQDRLVKLFKRGEVPIDELRTVIKEVLQTLTDECENRGYELKRVSSGYRYQVRQDYSEWVSRLWEEKPPRYSRALMETLALIAYKQPVTRGDVEQVRGVAVSQNILRTLLERGWVRVVGVRDVPGKPAMYGTTKTFLDYFNLKSLNQLPPLDEIRSMLPEEPTVEEDAPEPKPLPDIDVEEDDDEEVIEVRVAVEVDPTIGQESAEAPADAAAEAEDAGADDEQAAEADRQEEAPLAEVVQLPTQSA